MDEEQKPAETPQPEAPQKKKTPLWMIILIAIAVSTLIQTVQSFMEDDKPAKEKGQAALMVACFTGDETEVQNLLEAGRDANAKFHSATPLLAACYSDNPKVVELLLKGGADPDKKSSLNMNSLPDEIRQQYVEEGDDPTATMCPLHITSLFWSPELTGTLLEAGASPDALNSEGLTPLMMATVGPQEVLQGVSQMEAYYKRNGETNPVLQAIFKAMGKVAKRTETEQLQVMRLLLEKGAQVDAKDPDGETALIAATAAGNMAATGLLLEKGADINVRNANGCTPLMAAAVGGNTDIIRLLLDKGADANATDNEGNKAEAYTEDPDCESLLRAAQTE